MVMLFWSQETITFMKIKECKKHINIYFTWQIKSIYFFILKLCSKIYIIKENFGINYSYNVLLRKVLRSYNFH